uniref:Rho-GAP domain-containing protein n=1 Tax=Acanthochromis polyacanthus TaxID=80966 RepID=A0A3Q1EYV6_9TELE
MAAKHPLQCNRVQLSWFSVNLSPICRSTCAGACHNKTAVQVKEDMKKMVQIPIFRPRTVAAKHTRLFGVSLFELREKGLVEDGVPLVVQMMVEHLRKHALHQEGLFRVNGNVRAVETLKQQLESGEDVDLLSQSDMSTVASLLKQFLRDLPEGLVSSMVQQALIQHYQGKKSTCGSTSLLYLPTRISLPADTDQVLLLFTFVM